MSNHKNALKTAWNDITGDTIRTGKGSHSKYADNWDAIFGRKKTVDKNPQDDALFADMHNLKEDFSLDRAFANVQSRLPRHLEACLCVACGEAVIYNIELKRNPIQCPHCDCTIPVYFGSGEPTTVMALDFPDSQPEGKLQALVSEIAESLPDDLPNVMCGKVHD